MKRLAHNLLKQYVRYFPISKGKNRMISYLWKPLSLNQHVYMAALSQAKIKRPAILLNQCNAIYISGEAMRRSIVNIG